MVWPWLRPDQAKVSEELRQAEDRLLKPLRRASRIFEALKSAAPPLPQAQEIAALFEAAPRHILQRLTLAQLQAVLVATAMARQAAGELTRVASV